jgi:tetratricopeptide (TPR) repeat protein
MIAILGWSVHGAVLGAQSPAMGDYYDRGKAALDAKHYEEAEQEFEQAETHSPGATNALALRAKALIHLNRFEEAQHCLNDYLKIHSESADAKYLLAYVLFRRDMPRESLSVYTAAAALKRPTADDFKIVALDYVLLNDNAEAIGWLERSVSEGSADAEAVYYLGRSYYVANHFDKAVAAFERALQLNPQYAKAENNLGLAFAAKNEPGQAEAAYRKAIQMGEASREKSDQPYINLAELLMHTDHQSEALSLLEEAEKIGGKSDHAEELRGQILLAQNHLKDAEAAFRAAVSMKPDNGALHYLLGRVLKLEGKVEDAEKEFAQTKALAGTQSSTAN